MFLREFIYFDRDHADMQDDNRYLSKQDTAVLKRTDVRKTRLTLRMINVPQKRMIKKNSKS
jgi:hypothetical protein